MFDPTTDIHAGTRHDGASSGLDEGCDHVPVDVPPIGAGDPAAPPSRAVRAVIWYQRTFAGGTPSCRFFPSCSSYAREALELHGTRRGMWLTVRRLARCRPFGPSGVDPVPEPSPASVRKAF